MVNKKQGKAIMNRAEAFWDRTAKSQDRDNARFQKVTNKIIENTKPYLKANDVVLDYGCGTGTKTFEFAGHVKKMQGIDFS